MSEIIIVIATVVMAISSSISCFVAYRIHQASLRRDREMTDLYVNIMASIIISGKFAGESQLSIRLLEDQKKELSKKLFGTSNR
jgi:hypothetical protein